MTLLRKKIKRVSNDSVRECGEERKIIITMEPPNLLGFRATGCRQTYYLTAGFCYHLAVKAAVAAKIKP
jgi:hypothetical protein